MIEEVEQLKNRICLSYKKIGIDIKNEQTHVYNNESYWKRLYQLVDKDYISLKVVLDTCPRPFKSEISRYKEDPKNKVSDISYADFDDRTFGLVSLFPKNIDSYENLLKRIYRYEQEEEKHVHKGTIYYFLAEEYFKKDDIEKGLLFTHKAFIEDDLKHLDARNYFPNTPAYKFIILNIQEKEQSSYYIVKRIVNFLEETFFRDMEHLYDAFFNGFLNKASITENHKWLDQVIFFNSFAVKLDKIYRTPEEVFDSMLGEIMLSSITGDFCLLIESFCKVKLNLDGVINTLYTNRRNGIRNLYGWQGNSINRSDFEGSELAVTLKTIFNNNYASGDSLQNSFFLTWGLRNNFHHNIESMAIIRSNFKEIIKKQMEFFVDFAIK